MRTGELRVLALVVPGLVIVEALTRPALIAWSTLDLDSYSSVILAAAQTYDRAIIGFYILTTVIFARWIYVAGRNLATVGAEDLQFTPASRIWWFAVPFANFVMPFRGMRELWNASHGETDRQANHWVVVCWWVLWLGNGVASYLAGRFGEQSDLVVIIESLIGLALAGIAITLVRRISEAQIRLSTSPDLVEIFA